MPKGQPAVLWTGDQDAKLFLAILAVHKMDFDTKEVAKIFGGNVPSSCIQTRLQKLRKKARELTSGPQTTVMSTTFSKPNALKATAARLDNSKKKPLKRKRGGMLTSDSDGDEDLKSTETSEDEEPNGKRFHTAPLTPSRQTSIAGQIVKPRISPRNLAKKNYKAIEDPFLESGAFDADGNEIFEKSAEEDSSSGDEYGKVKDGKLGNDNVGDANVEDDNVGDWLVKQEDEVAV